MTTYRVFQRAEGLNRPIFRGVVKFKTVAEQNTGVVAMLYENRPGARVDRNRKLCPRGTRIISVALWDSRNRRYIDKIILIPVPADGRGKSATM